MQKEKAGREGCVPHRLQSGPPFMQIGCCGQFLFCREILFFSVFLWTLSQEALANTHPMLPTSLQITSDGMSLASVSGSVTGLVELSLAIGTERNFLNGNYLEMIPVISSFNTYIQDHVDITYKTLLYDSSSLHDPSRMPFLWQQKLGYSVLGKVGCWWTNVFSTSQEAAQG